MGQVKQASPVPFRDVLPRDVRRDVYDATIALALRYAKAGVEGRIHGHILAIGRPPDLLRLGKRNKFDPFEMQLSTRKGNVMEAADAEEIRRCMDCDGMTLIDGSVGTPFANKFFSSQVSSSK